MSSAELLLTLVVALLVFGPSKLPMLASHLAKLVRFMSECRLKLMVFWQSQLNEQQLLDNLKKAEKADEQYLKKSDP